ncbi:LCP family protein [Streptomyces chryseus]|uniref:LytR family transcriptional regulator n=2 Tax=Streptomyces chryseus TaxID=68186 RepID=A0ABQ3EBK5_9ACTN|nr:LCP family protein [Streptomyces chryseus]GHB27239.1 LytR family transcriptional regulator [Streptomyces chryseus]
MPQSPRPQKGRSRRQDERPQWSMRLFTTISVLVLCAGGIGHAVVSGMETGIERVDPFKDMKNRPAPGHGTNILLVGTDGRERITAEEKRKYRLGGEPCHCTDTIMVVHLSADKKRASVVSLPRDSYAEVPAHTDQSTGKHHNAHPAKINAAYAEGGPGLTVRTVEHMTKVKIDHYLEVDFTSFMRTVDVIGGVEVCTVRPLKDHYTGLDLPVGTHRLNGGQALQYVRSRHIDGAADFGRMQRQQRFLAAFVAKAGTAGVLLNPVKFRQVTTTLLGSVRADKGFGTREMLDLGRAMRGFKPASSEFTSVPVSGVDQSVAGIGSTVKWDEAKAKRLFQHLRDDKPLAPLRPRAKAAVVDVAPQQIDVQVYNGTLTRGLGKRVDDALRSTGFRTTRSPEDADRHDVKRTLVTYDPRWDRSAKSLQAALPGCELRAVDGQGGLLKVMAGTDFKGVRAVRADEPHRGEFGTVTGDQVVCR